MLVFDKEKCNKNMEGVEGWSPNEEWLDECNGKPVRDTGGLIGYIGFYMIWPGWCREVPDENSPAPAPTGTEPTK